MAAFKWSGRTFGSLARKITQSLDEFLGVIGDTIRPDRRGVALQGDARDRIEEWRCQYNQDRPHSALGCSQPSTYWKARSLADICSAIVTKSSSASAIEAQVPD